MKKFSFAFVIALLISTLVFTACGSKKPKQTQNEGTLTSQSSQPITQEVVQGNAKSPEKYEPFFEIRTEGAIIPALKQGLVPQSVGYIQAEDWFIIGGYRDGSLTSLVTVVDASTDELIKTVQFRNRNGTFYTAHAGGLAISEKHLWISSGEQVHYIELDKIVQAEDLSTLHFSGHLPIDARGSFVSYSEGILWVGDFALAPNYPTKTHHHLTNRDGVTHTGWIAGYTLDPVTDLIPTTQPRVSSAGAYIPNYALSIRDKIQESSILGDQIVLTESYGRNNVSHLFIYDNPMKNPPHDRVTIGSTSVPFWFLDNENLTSAWTLPPMAEGIVQRNDETFIIFESAAQKYLDGSYALSRLQVVKTEDLLGWQ